MSRALKKICRLIKFSHGTKNASNVPRATKASTHVTAVRAEIRKSTAKVSMFSVDAGSNVFQLNFHFYVIILNVRAQCQCQSISLLQQGIWT